MDWFVWSFEIQVPYQWLKEESVPLSNIKWRKAMTECILCKTVTDKDEKLLSNVMY